MASNSNASRRVVSSVMKTILIAFVSSILVLAAVSSSSMLLEAIDDTILHKINWLGPLPDETLLVCHS